MKIFVFGSSLLSSYWNGAATYYRGIYRQLHALGHEITFAEPDIYGRQQHRDAEKFDYARSLIYETPGGIPFLLGQAASAELVIKHSGVGAEDELLERGVASLASPADERSRQLHPGPRRPRTAFWDVDAPATLSRLRSNMQDALRPLIPRYDFIFTYGGGDAVVREYGSLGAQACVPVYNALDPQTHFPVAPVPGLVCDLAFVGHRLPDREARVEALFFRAAELAPEMTFLLGGEGWASKRLPRNVRWLGHVATADHNRVNASARMVLNINRESMAVTGYSPPTRIFEAAGAAACVITDQWPGVGEFFEPGVEILVARDAAEIVGYLRNLNAAAACQIGGRMRARALAEHTYAQRARQVDAILGAAAEAQRSCAEAAS